MWISLFYFQLDSFIPAAIVLLCYVLSFHVQDWIFILFLFFFLLQQNQIMLVNWVGGMDLQV